MIYAAFASVAVIAFIAALVAHRILRWTEPVGTKPVLPLNLSDGEKTERN